MVAQESLLNHQAVPTLETHDSAGASPYSKIKFTPPENLRDKIQLKQPDTFEERMAEAKHCHESLKMLSSIAVDGMDNAIWEPYGESPNCAYLIGTDGKIVCQQGLFESRELRKAIEQILPPAK